MAGDVGGLDVSQHGPLTALVGLVSAGLGAFGLWLANRMLGKAAFQTAINAGFKDLTDQLQEERKDLQSRWDAERVAWAAERAQLRGEIINLTQAVESLKSLLRRRGIDVPETHSPPTDFLILDGDKG
jgi:cation transport regulator ChaB